MIKIRAPIIINNQQRDDIDIIDAQKEKKRKLTWEGMWLNYLINWEDEMRRLSTSNFENELTSNREKNPEFWNYIAFKKLKSGKWTRWVDMK